MCDFVGFKVWILKKFWKDDGGYSWLNVMEKELEILTKEQTIETKAIFILLMNQLLKVNPLHH